MDGVQPELTFLFSLIKRENEIWNSQSEANCTSGAVFGYTFTHRAIIQPLHKKIIYGTPMCTQSSLAASLIKRAHGANKKLFCEFFGFFPMSKEQRKEGRQRRLPLSLYSSTLFRGPMSICTLSDALRGFDLHLIPSTKELTCLCLVLWFQFFSFSVSLKILTHTHIAIACTESPTFAAAL